LDLLVNVSIFLGAPHFRPRVWGRELSDDLFAAKEEGRFGVHSEIFS